MAVKKRVRRTKAQLEAAKPKGNVAVLERPQTEAELEGREPDAWDAPASRPQAAKADQTQPPLAGQLMVIQEYMKHQGINSAVRQERTVEGSYYLVRTVEKDQGPRKIRLEMERNVTAISFLNEELRNKQSELADSLWRLKALKKALDQNAANINLYSNLQGDRVEQSRNENAVNELKRKNSYIEAEAAKYEAAKTASSQRIDAITAEKVVLTVDVMVWEYDLDLPGLEIRL